MFTPMYYNNFYVLLPLYFVFYYHYRNRNVRNVLSVYAGLRNILRHKINRKRSGNRNRNDEIKRH